MIIREAKKSDFEEWFKLEKGFVKFQNKFLKKDMKCSIAKPGMKKYFMKVLKRKSLFLVLENDKKLQGYFEGLIEGGKAQAFVCQIKKMGYINNVFITRKYRGKGYFSKFIQAFYEYLKKNKVKYCSLDVDKDNPAVEVYKKLGYKIIEHKMLAKIK